MATLFQIDRVVGSKMREKTYAKSKIEFVPGHVEMKSAPICPEWILNGDPVFRNAVLSTSPDGLATTFFWDSTAGQFNWFYDIDETLCILEGSVIIRADSGVESRLNVGDTAFFPAGSHAVWHVESYVRKVAFLRRPLPRILLYPKRVIRAGLQFLRAEVGGKRPEP